MPPGDVVRIDAADLLIQNGLVNGEKGRLWFPEQVLHDYVFDAAEIWPIVASSAALNSASDC